MAKLGSCFFYFGENGLAGTSTILQDSKAAMRRAAYDVRNAQEDKDRLSQAAVENVVQLSEYCAANTVLWYLDCRSELRTRQVLPQVLASAKTIVVPYCTVDEAGANK